MEFFNKLFQHDFMPHGHCYLWDPAILWSHAISDGIIALAYCSIPISLIYIFRRRADFKYIWMMILFAVFIFGCGLTHVFDVINIWEPYYRVDSIIRGITALASIGTAFVLVRVTPRLVNIPSAEQWIKVNEELQRQLIQLKEKDKIIEAIQQFEDLTEAVPQIMYMMDENRKLLYVNNKWTEYTGDRYEHGTNERIEEFLEPYIPVSQQQVVKTELVRKLGTDEKIEMHLQLRDRDQQYKWFLTRCIPVTGKDSGRKWFGILLEVDEQFKRNEELRDTNDSLLRINNDLDNFIYTASHDLKTPISNMEGILGILAENDSDRNSETYNQMMALLKRSVFRLKTTIEDITDISRIQKEQPDDIEQVSFQEMYEAIIQDLNFEIQNLDLSLITDFRVSQIQFSRKNLRSIIYNLVSNAIKYHKPYGKVIVEISTYQENDQVVLSVKDNGTGIKPEHQMKIFEMFKRYSQTKDGTGIGLYIVKRIIENEGGMITLESELNQGSTFRVKFKNMH